MIKVVPPQRKTDKWGSGEYKASRGNRLHNGIDIEVPENSKVLSNTSGVVSKLGYTYKDDLSFRYIEITTRDDLRYRFFYVLPSVSLGDKVKKESVLGASQRLEDRYPGITPHIHFEVKTKNGMFLDPNEYI